jgi:pimeloyl-ACP methyl ester carboxylesterase
MTCHVQKLDIFAVLASQAVDSIEPEKWPEICSFLGIDLQFANKAGLGGAGMIHFHSELNVQVFRDEPQTVMVNTWQVNYLAFSRPENQHKTPLVLVGGAFQEFHSFISDIKAYLPQVPVILIALPGQSSNRDPRDPSALTLKDLADLMEGLFQSLGLQSVTLAGFSYGSLTAYTYAYHYERRLEKLILVGCSLQLRHALRELLRYGAEQCYPENLHDIAEAMSQTLFNLNARTETGVSMRLVERLTQSIRRMSPKDMGHYRSNSARLLQANVAFRSFKVRTLVVTARYDHFVMPHESYDVYQLFKHADFVLVDKGDHLVPLQAPQLIYRTVLQFLNDRPYEGEGVLHGEPAVQAVKQRRRQPRHRVRGMQVTVTHPEGFRFEGQLDDISRDGCGMSLQNAWSMNAEFEGTWYVEIGASQYLIPGFLRIENGKANFVFLKKTFAETEVLNGFIESLQDEQLDDKLLKPA